MTEMPETHYVKSDDVHIAYQSRQQRGAQHPTKAHDARSGLQSGSLRHP
jgi:hypothetical protein